MHLAPKALIRSCLLGFFALAACDPSPAAPAQGGTSAPAPPRYVFLFIGDGMGLAQVQLTDLFLRQQPNAQGVSFMSFPATGLARTHSRNSLITDSAAAATALATGHKADQEVVSRESASGPGLSTLSHLLGAQGKGVGIVTSTSLDHATPAVFYTHEEHRSRYYEIALGLARSDVGYLAGGGFRKPRGRKGDEPNALERIEAAGFRLVNDMRAFADLRPGAGRIIFTSPLLDDKQALPYEIERPEGAPRLRDLVRKGIELLDGDAGFFLLVEGGKIDWACHANDAASAVHETAELSEAVQVAVEWQDRYPQETLIVVTADHETGGLGLGYTGQGYHLYPERLAHQRRSFRVAGDAITAHLRQHPKARLSDLYPLLAESFGLHAPQGKDAVRVASASPTSFDPAPPSREVDMFLTPSELAELEQALEMSRRSGNMEARTEEQRVRYADYEPVSVTAARIVGRKAGVSWTTFHHTGIPVPVYAKGPGSETFVGVIDNTDIAKKILQLTNASAAAR